MATSPIVDQYGRAIEYDQLTEELAAPRLTGVRQLWHQSVAGNLTPGRLVGLLQAAVEGDATDYLTLAEEMQERDLHYASVLGTRKLAVAGLAVTVESVSDERDDVRRADAVREMVVAAEFDELRADLVEALGAGYAVSEIMWDRSGKTWMPQEYKERDPRHFRFDRATGRELRLLDEADMMDGIAMAPYKFIVHYPRIRAGLPIRGGLARLAAVAYMCKSWAWKDWMAFADIFGMPMRVGTYGPGASKDDISKLMAAVANLGSDAAAVMPQSMKIDFTQAAQTAGAGDFFRGLAEWWDKQISKGVLGQTMTTDDGSSNAQAQVHQLVRLDLLSADATALQNTLQRALVRPFVDLNFGPGKYPILKINVPKPEDIAQLMEALAKLVPLGLEVEQSVIRDKLGLPDPDPKGVLLKAPAPTPTPMAAAINRALNAEQAAEQPGESTDETISAQLDRNAGPMTDAWIAKIRAMVEHADDLDAVRDGLMQLQADLSLDDFAQAMAGALGAARMAGRYDLLQEAGL